MLLVRLEDEPGVAVYDTTFTPRDPADRKYADQTLPALRFLVTDRTQYDPTRLAARVFAALRDIHSDSLRLTSGLERLAGSTALRTWIESGESYERLYRSWESGIAEFRRIREPFLLYR